MIEKDVEDMEINLRVKINTLNNPPVSFFLKIMLINTQTIMSINKLLKIINQEIPMILFPKNTHFMTKTRTA